MLGERAVDAGGVARQALDELRRAGAVDARLLQPGQAAEDKRLLVAQLLLRRPHELGVGGRRDGLGAAVAGQALGLQEARVVGLVPWRHVVELHADLVGQRVQPAQERAVRGDPRHLRPRMTTALPLTAAKAPRRRPRRREVRHDEDLPAAVDVLAVLDRPQQGAQPQR